MARMNQSDLMRPYLTGATDTYIKLTQARVLVISEDVTDTMAADLSAVLLYLDHENNEPINMYLHTNGGAVSGLSNIYDVMQMINSPVRTFCIGKCYSAGAILLASGSPGERYAFANSSIMIHGIQTVFPYPGDDVSNSKNYYDFLKDNNDNIMKILAHHTGKSLEEVKADCKEDLYLDAFEALEYGLIDNIV